MISAAKRLNLSAQNCCLSLWYQFRKRPNSKIYVLTLNNTIHVLCVCILFEFSEENSTFNGQWVDLKRISYIFDSIPISIASLFDYIEFSEPCAQRIHFRPLSLRQWFSSMEDLTAKNPYRLLVQFSIFSHKFSGQPNPTITTYNRRIFIDVLFSNHIFCVASFNSAKTCDWLDKKYIEPFV